MRDGTEHLTTTEIQQIVQREVDTCRNNGMKISGIEIDYGADISLCVRVDELAFFKGRFIVGKFLDGTEYIPVERVLSIGFNYKDDAEDNEGNEDGEDGDDEYEDGDKE